MKRLANAVVMASLLMGLALAQTGPQPQTSVDPSRQPMFIKFENLKWEKITLPQGDCTPELAYLRVDPKTQAAALIIRHPANCYVPKHWHSANEIITVISGTFILECEGKREALGPGSMGYVPSKMIHRAWTKTNEGALTFIHVDGAWDINWVKDTSQPPRMP